MGKTDKLTSINGPTPEEYIVIQNAAEEKVRKKNRKQYLYYVGCIGVIVFLA